MPMFRQFYSSVSQKGSALISALSIMTIVAIAATTLSLRMQLESYRAELSFINDKLALAAQLVPYWAMQSLSQIPKHPWISNNDSAKILIFPERWQHLYPDIRIQGEIYDLQALFNLNNLTNRNVDPFLTHLLGNLSLTLKNDKKQALLQDIINWISPAQPDQGEAPWISAYLKQDPPYLPSQQPFSHFSELRLLTTVDSIVYQALSAVTTALPENNTPININTASKEILASLGKGLDKDGLQTLLDARKEGGSKTIAKLYPLLKKYHIPPEQITLESRYFLNIASAESGRMKLTLYTILKRERKDKNIKISIVSQSLNSP